MKFHRRNVSALILLVVASGAASGQAPQSKFTFDVATIKPAAPLDQAQMIADVRAGKMPKVGPEMEDTRAAYT